MGGEVGDEPPQSIRIGYRTYLVEVMSPMIATGKDVYGECDNCNGAIRIRADIDPVKQERTVAVLANILSQVWRDNPDLVRFFDARLGP